MPTLTFEGLLNEIRKIPVFESRIDEEDMKEFVIESNQITPLHLILQEFFGKEFKSPGQNPSLEDKRHAARWGGVRQYQTLYYNENLGFQNCAMFWPWNDGDRCTVKIAHWNPSE